MRAFHAWQIGRPTRMVMEDGTLIDLFIVLATPVTVEPVSVQLSTPVTPLTPDRPIESAEFKTWNNGDICTYVRVAS